MSSEHFNEIFYESFRPFYKYFWVHSLIFKYFVLVGCDCVGLLEKM